MGEGKCETKDVCLLSFNTIDGCECWLDFGRGTTFHFKYVSESRVSLERKNMSITIPEESFVKLFKKC